MKIMGKEDSKAIEWTGETLLGMSEILPAQLSLESIADLSFAFGAFLKHYFLKKAAYVIWCREGKINVATDDGIESTIGAGEFLIIYPGRCIDINGNAKRNLATRLIITGENTVDWLDGLGFYDHFSGQDSLARSHIDIIKRTKAKMLGADAKNRPALNALVLRLTQNLLLNTRENIANQGSRLFFNLIPLFNVPLHTGSVRIKEVANSLGISPNTIHLAFKSNGLSSPGAYIAHRQIMLALNLLRETSLPIMEIAKKCGFQTAAHFTTFVKRQTGRLPSSFRK